MHLGRTKVNLKPKPVLVMIGGGHSHSLVLRQIIRDQRHAFKIVLISDEEVTPYSGLLPGQIAGIYAKNEMTIRVSALAREAGAEFIQGKVEGIDFLTQVVHTSSGERIHYDFLSINCGARPDAEALPGLQKFGHPLKPTLPFMKEFAEFVQQSAHFKTVRLVQIGGGIGGIECVAAFHRKFFDLGIATEITLVDSGSELLHTHHPQVRRSVLKMLNDYQIRVILGESVREITRDEVITRSGMKIPSDFTSVATPAKTEAWVRDLDLASHQGFIQIDEYLRTSRPYVFAAGDIAQNPALPVPRAGVFAVRQAKVLYANLFASHSGQRLQKYSPQKNYLTLISDGHGKAIASRGAYYFPRSFLMSRLKSYIDCKFMDKLNRNLP